MRKVLVLLILGLVVTMLFPSANPGGYGSYPPPNDGDWVIRNETLVENETIVLNGNLIVETDGNLTLRNVTLRMDCVENGSYHIEVKNGGEMQIYDSNITSNIPDGKHRFGFWVREGAKFGMRDSELHECGYLRSWWGLYIETDYCQISDSIFSNNFYAILLYNSNHSKIVNCSFWNNLYGIDGYNSDNNSIINCEFGNNYCATEFLDFTNATILSNSFFNNSIGLFALSLVGSLLSNNTFTNNSNNFGIGSLEHGLDTGLIIDTTNTINGAPIYCLSNLKNFVISPDTGFEKIGCLAIANSINITIEDLTLHNNRDGLYLMNTIYSKIQNVSFMDNQVGIYLLGSSNVQINNCYLKNNLFGILNRDSNNNTIQNCLVINSKSGNIWLDYSSNNYINNCIISNSGIGIWINRGRNNTIHKCNINQQYSWGLCITSSNNKIEHCNITENRYGISIDQSSRNNSIFFNKFISNILHAIDNSSENYWDNGKAGGNYWDDYIGLDDGSNNRIAGDGIGDTNLPHLGLDNYPFIEKDGWLDYTPQDTDGDEIPDLIDPDIDDDGFPNENDAYPYDKNKWRTEEVESNWAIVLGAMIILTIGVIILGIVITLLSRKKRGD